MFMQEAFDGKVKDYMRRAGADKTWYWHMLV